MPVVFHRLNFAAGLSAVNQFAALSLQKPLFDMNGLPRLLSQPETGQAPSLQESGG